MKSCHQRCLASLFLLFIFFKTVAQDQRAYNQNSARSNNAKAYNQNPARSNHGLSISFSPLYSAATKSSSDSLLFRGSGAGLRFGADYFFGNAGISFSSGFGTSSPDDATINNFLKHSSIPTDQLLITKTKQQNMYLLLGPSVRFGSKVQLYAHAKGGLFINNSGLISMQQRGAQKVLYRNESTSKNIYPGFLTGLKIQYSTKSDAWSFGIGTDYMHTRTEVNNYDVRRGSGIEALKLSRNITDLVTGITIQYNIRSPRDATSGQASGKRQVGKPIYEDINVATREAGSGLATGRRSYQPGQPVYGNITREETPAESCGSVTQRITNPDGTTEEMTFACPADAASYNERISMNVTVPKQTQGATFGEKVNQGLQSSGIDNKRLSTNVTAPKQTQGATFGEKVNQGLHAAGSALSQGRNIISGRLSTASESSTGVITNKTAAVSSVSTMAGGAGGGAAAASYARTANNQSAPSGLVTTIYAREAGSGQASGRRSREAGSGMATGRRQYEPVFSEGQGDVCNPCIATAKMSNVKNNPLYEDKGQSGVNPMYESKKTTGGGDNDCDGIAGMTVSLVEPQSGAVIAKTITERCGDFFFANVPDGDYVVKINGIFLSKKGYDYYAAKSKTDLLGKVTLGDEALQLLINTGGDDDDMTQKAGISTSRSNIRCRSITIVDADTDGDGVFESTKVLAELYDGTTKDITAFSRMTTAGSVKKVTVRGWNPEKKEGVTGFANSVKEYTISISNDNKAAVTNQYENGTKEELTVAARVSHHPNVVQYIIPVDEEDSEVTNTGARAKITKSRSNIQNNRMANDGEHDDIWSPRSNIKMLRLVPADMDGDGSPEMAVAAPFVPGGAVISAAMRPGNPIGGLTIKGGKNPGGNQRTVQTNESGEFEFMDLEPGDYTFYIEQRVFIEDETFITAGSSNTRAQDYNSSRSNKTASSAAPDPGGNNGNSKAQDHNSSRSNKTSSVADGDIDNEAADNAARKGWDGTVKGGSKTQAQDYNSSRSNKSSGIVATDPDNGDGAIKKGNTVPVKWTAPEVLKRTVNTSRSNIRQLLASLDDLEEELDTDTPNDRYLVNTSRSNIKSQRIAIYDLRETLTNMEYMEKTVAMNQVKEKTTAMNMQFLALQESLTAMGNQYRSISNVLKTKHDTVKNSISNIR
jgi:hypothetical protein